VRLPPSTLARSAHPLHRAPVAAASRPNGQNASPAIGPSPDLRVLPRDTGGLLYRWFLLYRQDIQRV